MSRTTRRRRTRRPRRSAETPEDADAAQEPERRVRPREMPVGAGAAAAPEPEEEEDDDVAVVPPNADRAAAHERLLGQMDQALTELPEGSEGQRVATRETTSPPWRTRTATRSLCLQRRRVPRCGTFVIGGSPRPSGRDGRGTPETPSTYRGAETRSPLPVVLHEPRIAGSGRSSKWRPGESSTRRRSRASLRETRSATSTSFRTRVIPQAT